jgi:transaldolase
VNATTPCLPPRPPQNPSGKDDRNVTTSLQAPPGALERLNDTAEGLEIWWDSSPLIFDGWCRTLLHAESDPRKREVLAQQLRRMYDPERPADSLFVGVTTNPPLSLQAIESDPDTWFPWIENLARSHPGASTYELFWKTYTEVVKRGAAMFSAKFEATGYKRGYLSGQVDPRVLQDTQEMIREGITLNQMARNVMIKMPGTKEGIYGITLLTALGIPTNATLVFTLPQLIAVAEAVKKGLKIARAGGVDLSRWRSVVTMMLGRFEDAKQMALDAQKAGIELTETDKRWAGVAIFKKAYRIFKQRGYESKLLGASMRLGPTVDGKQRVWHLEKFAGGDVVLTIFPNIIEAWIKNYDQDPITPQMDDPVPDEVIERLLKIPYFAAAYDEHGIAPEDYITHGAVVETATSFSEATEKLQKLVEERAQAAR